MGSKIVFNPGNEQQTFKDPILRSSEIHITFPIQSKTFQSKHFFFIL